MKYSIVNGERREAFPSGVGICEVCNQLTIAKCGSRKVHHWAHTSLDECDKWWENETEWHRNWKNKFPLDWQEIIHKDETNGELHRADVKTLDGLVIEFQNSTISYEEQISREKFYKKMIWIINGDTFKKTFIIGNKLPNPKDEFVRDIVFTEDGSIFRHSLNPYLEKHMLEGIACQTSDRKDIEIEIGKSYVGHHLYKWKHARKNWLSQESKVFIDFGDENLYYLMNYDEYKLPVILVYSKKEILERLLKKK